MNAAQREPVAVLRCPPDASHRQIVHRTEEAIARLDPLPQRLRGARTVAVKINAGVPRLVLTQGRQTELTEPAVVEGVIRALRRRTEAEILVGDATTTGESHRLYCQLGLPERLAAYPGVRLVDFCQSPVLDVDTDHPQALLRRYALPEEVVRADAVVSVAKMKAHRSTGCTLSIKNLFGWIPPSVYGAPRQYLHDRLIRLPRALADLAWLLRPSLCVVDAIVAANHGEWHGTPLLPGLLIAGTNAVATDHVGARLMGFDPQADYPAHPFLYRRNHIALAAALGAGPNDPDRIEVRGDSLKKQALPFSVEAYSRGEDRPAELERGLSCVQAYREEQERLAGQHCGRLLALRRGGVLWDSGSMAEHMARERREGMDWRTGPQFVVRCVPPGEEVENFRHYAEDCLWCPAAAAQAPR